VEMISFIAYLLVGGIICLALLFVCFVALERYGEQVFIALRILREREVSKKKPI